MSDDFVEPDGPYLLDPEEEQRAARDTEEAVNLVTHEAQEELDRVALAYRRVFAGKAQQGDADKLSSDLAVFCSGYTSTYRDDPREHARMEGRREVFQRIMDFTRLDHDTIMRLYLSAYIKP